MRVRFYKKDAKTIFMRLNEDCDSSFRFEKGDSAMVNEHIYKVRDVFYTVQAIQRNCPTTGVLSADIVFE
jgi:hypothetical protein